MKSVFVKSLDLQRIWGGRGITNNIDISGSNMPKLQLLNLRVLNQIIIPSPKRTLNPLCIVILLKLLCRSALPDMR